jgi:hypothetical protein
MNKRQRKKKKNLKRAMRLVFKELREMSKEKFEKMLKSNEPTCTPETCEGECQGMGWCEMATKFREEEIPKIIAAGPIKEIECDTNITGGENGTTEERRVSENHI